MFYYTIFLPHLLKKLFLLSDMPQTQEEKFKAVSADVSLYEIKGIIIKSDPDTMFEFIARHFASEGKKSSKFDSM